MTAHHLISEADLTSQCAYCGHKFNDKQILDWKSVFHFQKHYKENTCICGKNCKIQVHYEGSGHDTWSQKILKKVKLEQIVK